MSDEGEKTCPLCAEEMDLTDQQLKPCKCGYQICVWCWHHILEMAEKDATEGRCPACRTPYNKEKIVGMAASCERLVSDVSVEKRKSQKPKAKPSEGRKQLSSVRVIQRNLVYIVGLPLSLADEDLLQRKEYFGQYGKVLKVSMSRTAAGVIQQFPNNSCSVYITYSKEEEAIRCIQSVHGFVLDGRSLKACFGTTKYCHAWLRNMPCSNPDCLYLHEIGSQEDSFTKDEIISAYTRSRVQQITGVTSNLQRRSGNMLPPPLDDYCNNSSNPKPIVKNASNLNTPNVPRSSPPNGNCSRSGSLPAAASWGTRAACQSSLPSSVSLTELSKAKPGAAGGTLTFSSAVTNISQAPPFQADVMRKAILRENCQITHTKTKPDSSKSLKQCTPLVCHSDVAEISSSPDRAPTKNQLSCLTMSEDDDRAISLQSDATNSDCTKQSFVAIPTKGDKGDDENMQSLYSGVTSMLENRDVGDKYSRNTRACNPLYGCSPSELPGNEGLQRQHAESHMVLPTFQNGKAAILANGVCASEAECDWRTNSSMRAVSGIDDTSSYNSQRVKDPQVSHLVSLGQLNVSYSSQHDDVLGAVSAIPGFLSFGSRGSERSFLLNGYSEKVMGVSSSVNDYSHSSNDNTKEDVQSGKFVGVIKRDAIPDTREDSIIANILSLDFDTLDESLTSPQNLAKLLGEADEQISSLKLPNTRKIHNNNQSRFSFARQEDSKNQVHEVEPYGVFGHVPSNGLFQCSAENRDQYLEKLNNGFTPGYYKGSDIHSTNPAAISSHKLPVSKAQVSAPPGFSAPSRSPPPGFSSNERMGHTFDALSGSLLLKSPLLSNNPYQVPQNRNIGGAGDIEFMDPAILAVGHGRLEGRHDNVRSNIPFQLNALENEAQLQLLLQNSTSLPQNLRFQSIGENSSFLGDSVGISPRLMDQSQGHVISPLEQLSPHQSRHSLMSNGHLDGWTEVQGGSSLRMAELLRNERLGYNKFYNGYGESTFQMPTSGSIYNAKYGM